MIKGFLKHWLNLVVLMASLLILVAALIGIVGIAVIGLWVLVEPRPVPWWAWVLWVADVSLIIALITYNGDPA